MTPTRYQISTTISPATWYQIIRLTTEYGTKREVITRAVQLLDTEYWKRQEANDEELALLRKFSDPLHVIGAELWARAGDMSLDEAARKYGTFDGAAKAAARLLEGVEVLDFDGEPLDKYDAITAYMESQLG